MSLAAIQDLESKLSRLRSKGSIRMQDSVVQTLIGQVREIVKEIQDEIELVSQINQLKKQASVKGDSKEAVEEARKAMNLLQEANTLKYKIEEKKAFLRRLESSVGALHTEIRKAA